MPVDQVLVKATLLGVVAGACACKPEPAQPTAEPVPTETISAEVRTLGECLNARAPVADFEDPSVAAEIKASVPALRGESADAVGDTFKKRFADRNDTCQVNVLVDGCIAFSRDEVVDQDEADAALEECEEARKGRPAEAEEEEEEEEETAAADEPQEPVLEMFEHTNYNVGKDLARVVRLTGSCRDLSRPAKCGASGRMQTFENEMSSYRLMEGYRAIFYDDTLYRGKKLRVPEDAAREEPDLRKKNFDEQASSVKIIGPDGKEL